MGYMEILGQIAKTAETASTVTGAAASTTNMFGTNVKKAKRLMANQADNARALTREANERQDKLLAEARQYENPAAVRARYEAAGINPLAAFGGGSSVGVSTPAATDVPVADTPDYPPGYLMNDPSAIAGMARQLEEVESIRLQNEAQRIQNKYMEQEKLLDIGYKENLNQLVVNQAITESTRNKIALNEVRLSEINVKVAEGQAPFKIKNAELQNDELLQAIAESQSAVSLNEQQKIESGMRINKMRVEMITEQAYAAFLGAQTQTERVKTQQAMIDLGLSEATAPYKIDLAALEAAVAREDLSQEQIDSLIRFNDLLQSNFDVEHMDERWRNENRLNLAKTIHEYTGSFKDIAVSFGVAANGISSLRDSKNRSKNDKSGRRNDTLRTAATVGMAAAKIAPLL